MSTVHAKFAMCPSHRGGYRCAGSRHRPKPLAFAFGVQPPIYTSIRSVDVYGKIDEIPLFTEFLVPFDLTRGGSLRHEPIPITRGRDLLRWRLPMRTGTGPVPQSVASSLLRCLVAPPRSRVPMIELDDRIARGNRGAQRVFHRSDYVRPL